MESLGTYHRGCIFKCGECGQKFNEYDLMKAHTHSCGHVNKKCTESMDVIEHFSLSEG